MAFYQDGSAFDPLFGDGSDGASTWSGDSAANINATTLSVTAAQTPASGVIIRCTSTFIPSSSGTITVDAQSGQAIGAHSAVCGGYGVPLGAIMAAIGSTAIPPLMRPGDDTASRTAGWLQILAKGNVQIDKAMTLNATAADASCGGAGGGLLVIVSAGTISGSSAIDVSGVAGHATGGAKGGGGGYSGEPGGHAGLGGSGGGGGNTSEAGGSGGAGYIAGKAGGTGAGGGGGSLDNAGANSHGNGGDLNSLYILRSSTVKPGVAVTPNASENGTTSGYGAGGDNGGGGGGGGSQNAPSGGNGGDAGSGGGGSGQNSDDPGDGAAGSSWLYITSSPSLYAGMPGGQAGGGGGGGQNAGRSGGAGASGIAVLESGQGNGAGGNGVAGTNGSASTGGAGGKGGNGGGAAGLCIMIAPSITYSGTVTGRHVKIEGAEALKFIKGFSI